MNNTESQDEDYEGFEDQEVGGNSERVKHPQDPPSRQSDQQHSLTGNEYEKKFTEKIIGLNSDDESSKDKKKSDSNEQFDDPQYTDPPANDDVPVGGDEYFDQDEEYLENESEHNEDQSQNQGIFVF